MALIPLLHELLDDYRRPNLHDLYDQHFGLGLWNDDILTPTTSVLPAPLRSGYLRPWRNLTAMESGVSTIRNDKTEFAVSLDVQQFKPEELKVKVVDGYAIVEGKHEERSDEHGFVSRQFTRKYKIPDDVDEKSLASSFSSDGVLVLKAAKKALLAANEKVIPITKTNQPALKNPKKGDKKTDRMEH